MPWRPSPQAALCGPARPRSAHRRAAARTGTAAPKPGPPPRQIDRHAIHRRRRGCRIHPGLRHRNHVRVASVHNLPMLEAIGRHNAVRFVPARGRDGRRSHERWICQGKPASFRGRHQQHRPWGANTLAGWSRHRSLRTPLIHLTSHTTSKFAGRHLGTVHEPLDQLKMLASVSKTAVRVRSPDHAIGILARAAVDALTSPTGPVSVEIPIDIQRMPVRRPAMLDNFTIRTPAPQAALERGIDELVERMRRAKHPDDLSRLGRARGRREIAALLTGPRHGLQLERSRGVPDRSTR